MLLNFSVENYKSFKDSVAFSMVPAQKQKGLDYSILKNKAGSKKLSAICSSVIYGPNAAGKTTIIGAMDTMRLIVLRGNILNSTDPYPNDAANNLELIPNNTLKERKPVKFAISFFENQYHIEYSFSMNLGYFLEKDFDREIIEELLCVNGIKVFERNKNLDLNYSTKIAEFFSGNAKSIENLSKVAKDSLNPKELFLMNGFKLIISRKLAEFIQDWFRDKFMVIYRANDLDLIRKFDDPKSHSFYAERTTNDAARIFGLNSNVIGYLVSSEDQQTRLCSILDDVNSKQQVVINAETFESYGTVRFVNIFPLIIKAMYTGGTLVIDEFDASIHPMALMNIINIFHDDEINKHHAQLIFDTHNPIFLNSNLLRRDEIKFVERKGESHTSEIYSLSDFGTSGKRGVRKTEDYMKNYFISQYGAISDIDFSPIFKELMSDDKEG